MIYEVTMYRLKDNKKKKMFRNSIRAINHVNALERAAVLMYPGSIIEIRAEEIPVECPPVRKISRGDV